MDRAGDELTSQSPVRHESSAELDQPTMPTSARALGTTLGNETSGEYAVNPGVNRGGCSHVATAEEFDGNLEARDATASKSDPPAQGTAVSSGITIDPEFEVLEVHDKEEGALMVDIGTPERYFWTDPITTLKREIWRPGRFSQRIYPRLR